MRESLRGIFLVLFLSWSVQANALIDDDSQCDKLATIHSAWSPTERWVWNQLCRSKVADLTRKVIEDPNAPSFDRYISSTFLETLLSDPRLSQAILPRGINIVGGIFPDKLDLSSFSITIPVAIERSLFEQNVELSNLRSERGLAFSHSYFAEKVIGQQMEVSAVDLQHASAGLIDISGSKIRGWLLMQGFEARQDFLGTLMQVDGDVIANDGAKFRGLASLKHTKVAGNITVANSEVGILDLSGTRVDGELQFGFTKQRATRWRSDGRLNLRIARAGGIRGWEEAWPLMTLEGFSYAWFQINSKDPLPLEWYVNWLSRADFSLQPYRKLSDNLREQGLKGEADAVLFAGLERQRAMTTGGRYFLMSLHRYLIGYGLGTGYFNAFFIALLLISMGRVILFLTKEDFNHEQCKKLGFMYSTATLIPAITLDKLYLDLCLKNPWAKRYFYIHRASGWVLLSFILAGLAGLSSK